MLVVVGTLALFWPCLVIVWRQQAVGRVVAASGSMAAVTSSGVMVAIVTVVVVAMEP
jgi:hypothetical protein